VMNIESELKSRLMEPPSPLHQAPPSSSSAYTVSWKQRPL
jgi:hypothetical protein